MVPDADVTSDAVDNDGNSNNDLLTLTIGATWRWHRAVPVRGLPVHRRHRQRRHRPAHLAVETQRHCPARSASPTPSGRRHRRPRTRNANDRRRRHESRLCNALGEHARRRRCRRHADLDQRRHRARMHVQLHHGEHIVCDFTRLPEARTRADGAKSASQVQLGNHRPPVERGRHGHQPRVTVTGTSADIRTARGTT